MSLNPTNSNPLAYLMMRKQLAPLARLAWGCVCLSVYLSSTISSAYAQAISQAQIITAPSAQHNKDGQLEFSLEADQWGEHAQLDYQVTPWLNLGVKYSHFDVLDFAANTATNSSTSPATNTANSIASYAYHANAQIFRQTDVLPAIAIGIEDFTGQANIQSRYISASKNIDNWRVDLGVASGQDPNSLDGVIAGVQYTLDDYPVVLRAQYINDAPEYDASHVLSSLPSVSAPASRHNQWAVQASWQFTPGVALSLTHGADNSVGLGITVALDTTRPPARYVPQPDLSNVANPDKADTVTLAAKRPISPPSSQVDTPPHWHHSIIDALQHIDISVHGIVQDGPRLQIVLSQTAYPYWPDAINQAHQALLDVLPDGIFNIDYVIKLAGHPVYRVSRDVIRDPELAKFVTQMSPRAVTQPMLDRFTQHDQQDQGNSHWQATLPDFSVGIVHQGWLNSQNKMSQLVQARIDLDWEFAPGWSITQQTQFDLAERWEFINAYFPNQQLQMLSPKIAGLVNNDVHLSQLMMRYNATQITSLYDKQVQYDYQLFAGIIDNQWAGFGANLLYQPWQSRVSLGLSLAQLTARDPDSWLGLADSSEYNSDIDSATVALASVYWASPFYNLDVALHAGRFVHQDTGAKLQIRRTFDNGWQFGIWAARTKYHSNSLAMNNDNSITETQQGLYLSIPLDNIFSRATRYSGKTYFTSRINQLDNTQGVMLDSVSEDRWWQLRAARYSVFNDVESMQACSDVNSEARLEGHSEAHSDQTWQLTVGQYHVNGQVTRQIDADGQTQYTFLSTQGDELVFDETGLKRINTLAQRPLALVFTDSASRLSSSSLSASNLSSSSLNSKMRKVTIGDLNYAAYLCSALVKDGYSATQMCQSQPVHRIQIQYNSDFEPVLIEQWLPYLQQHLQLNRLN
jgi:hypothetical protein